MASLTPGVLSKLLENVGNKDVKVTGEHRSALLQVIEIVPSFAKGDDPFQSRGYFLRVSDSKHSAYVSVSDEDLDLIYSDKIQLGQFVYVTRFDSASPVPVLRGLKSVSKRRPCVGNPIDLVSSKSLHIGAAIDFSKPGNGSKIDLKKDEGVNVKAKVKNLANDENLKSKRASPLKNNARSSPLKNSARSSPLKNGARASPLKNTAKVKVEVLDMRRLSLDSARRVWDQHPSSRSVSGTSTSRLKSRSSSISCSPNVTGKKASLKNVSPLKSPSSNISPLKNKNDNSSPKSTSTPLRKIAKSTCAIKSSCEGKIPSHLVKVLLNFETWYQPSFSWDDLPSIICNLGKQVVSHRNSAFFAAVRALEEAFVADSVIRCMCLFAEICQSSRTLSAGSLVEQFLDLHSNLHSAAMMCDSLLIPTSKASPTSNSSQRCMSEDVCKVSTNKNAISWVQAAIGTNLANFNLFRTQASKGEKCHYVVIENTHKETNTENPSPQNKPNRVTQTGILPNSTAKRVPSSKRQLSVGKNKGTDNKDQSKESRLIEAASLAEKLLFDSCEWFLKYLEDSLDNGFGLRSEEGSTEIACLLGQLKKVNHWLDNLVGGGDKVDHRVDKLRKSLYGFLLEHVNSAITNTK